MLLSRICHHGDRSQNTNKEGGASELFKNHGVPWEGKTLCCLCLASFFTGRGKRVVYFTGRAGSDEGNLTFQLVWRIFSRVWKKKKKSKDPCGHLLIILLSSDCLCSISSRPKLSTSVKWSINFPLVTPWYFAVHNIFAYQLVLIDIKCNTDILWPTLMTNWSFVITLMESILCQRVWVLDLQN